MKMHEFYSMGARNKAEEIALKLLSQGMSVETVSDACGLTKTEVARLQKKGNRQQRKAVATN